MKKTNGHQKYYTTEGVLVPGVTTILNLLAKPALIDWAWKLGIKGKDYRAVRDNAGDTGTIAHLLCECDMQGEKPDLTIYSQALVEKAKVSFMAFLDFKKNNNIVPIKNELQLVSDTLLYGGTIDCYCELNGHKTLLDFKTSSGFYPEMRLQLAAYKNLLEENGCPVEKVHLLRIDKDNGEFTDHTINTLDREFDMFKALRKVYEFKQIVWKE